MEKLNKEEIEGKYLMQSLSEDGAIKYSEMVEVKIDLEEEILEVIDDDITSKYHFNQEDVEVKLIDDMIVTRVLGEEFVRLKKVKEGNNE